MMQSWRGNRGWLLLALLIGAATGLFFGFFIKNAEGHNCGPLPGIGVTVGFFALAVVGAIMLVVSLISFLLGRPNGALAMLVAVAGLAAGVVIGLLVGTPAPPCGYPSTSETEPAVLTLQVNEPLSADVVGPGRCSRVIDSGTVTSVEREDEGPEPVHWVFDGIQVIDVAMGYGGTDPGLQIGFFDEDSHANAVFRQTADSQVTQTAAADPHAGSFAFEGLPLFEYSGEPGPLEGIDSLSGSIAWRCPDDSLSPQ